MENRNFRNNRLSVIYTKNKLKGFLGKKNKKGRKIFLKIFLYTFLIFLVGIGIAGGVIYNKYLSGLPSVKELENLDLARASTIYDRDGKELNKIFEEKRTYVGYSQINKNMVNALVAGEDKQFFTNQGVDLQRFIGAFVNYGLGKTEKVEGTSTITQQLIRNTLIANEKTFERKIKEMYLSYKVSKELSKEKVLELYLNKIAFGSNAYGIEQASKTFFGKQAKDLGILESSILASLPKGPTYYSPYSHPDRVLGYPYISSKADEKSEIKILNKNDLKTNSDAVSKFTSFLGGIKAKRVDQSNIILCGLKKEFFKNNISIDADGCSVMGYDKLLTFLNSIRISIGDDNYIEYQTGRKDFILGRMLEDGYIEFDKYSDSINKSIAYEFKTTTEKVKYAHFVDYVKEYLEKKYGKELIERGGLEIYTSIDPKLQDKAEELITKATSVNGKKYGAADSALVSIDNKTGQILAMVGGKDYYAEGNGNVNITTSKLQPGSSFKPFVYSLAIFKNAIGSKTPVFDLKMRFPGGYSPKDFDGTFMGKMNVSTALDASRNIPAIQMFYLAGGETDIVSFMNKLGVKSLNSEGKYGAPLALGTGEMTPLELASSYSSFANLGQKVETTPIIKIVDFKNKVLEDNSNPKTTNVIDDVQAYIINYILSDTSSRPAGWNPFLTLKGRKVAAKTGTSTKQYVKNGKKYIFPANLWTAGYTPQITTVVWSGNIGGKEVKMNGDGLNVSGPIWRDFMEFAHKGKTALTWKEPKTLKKVTISSLTGLPVSSSSNQKFNVLSLFKNIPKKYDKGTEAQKVDILCNGQVSEKTPEEAIKMVNVLEVHSLKPNDPAWENPVQEWIRNGGLKSIIGDSENFVTNISDKVCDRSSEASDIKVSSSIKDGDTLSLGNNNIEINYDSSNPIQKIQIILDKDVIQEVKINNIKSGTYKGNINIPDSFFGKQTITIKVIDSMYYDGTESKQIRIGEKDNSPPKITISNPGSLSIKIYDDQTFNLRGSVDSKTNIKSVNIYLDGKPLKLGLTSKDFVFPIEGKNIENGIHELKVEAVNTDFNIGTETIKLEIIAK